MAKKRVVLVKKRSTRNPGVKALKAVRRLRRQVGNPERKMFQLNSSANLTTTPTVTSLLYPNQGDAYTERVGKQIKPKSLEFRMYTYANAAQPVTNVRFLIVKGKKENGTPVAITDILEGNGPTYIPDVLLNYEHRNKITVIADKTFTLSNSGSNITRYHRTFGLRGKLTFVDDTTAISDGGYYLVMFSNIISGNTPVLDFSVRFIYTDA